MLAGCRTLLGSARGRRDDENRARERIGVKGNRADDGFGVEGSFEVEDDFDEADRFGTRNSLNEGDGESGGVGGASLALCDLLLSGADVRFAKSCAFSKICFFKIVST